MQQLEKAAPLSHYSKWLQWSDSCINTILTIPFSYLLIVFFIGSLSIAGFYEHGDEILYQTGASKMLEDNEWLIPKTKDGLMRFNKPPLAYWLVAISFTLFGIDPFIARLPAILFGCMTMWLTHRLACKITNSKIVSRYATLILFTVPTFVTASVESETDIYLCFFVLLSVSGFLQLIAMHDFNLNSFFQAYGGVAGAILSKGFLGLGVLLFAWIFAFLQLKKFSEWKKNHSYSCYFHYIGSRCGLVHLYIFV